MALPAGDPLWYYKALGLHCDGTNGSTTFTDTGPSPKTVTANGNAQISTAQYPALTGKASSGVLDGTGDYLSLADNNDFDLGAGDFTLRARIRIAGWSTSHAGDYYFGLFSKDNSSGRSFNVQVIGTSSSFTTLRFNGFSDDTTYTQVDVSFSFALNTWYDVEVTRSGDFIYSFVEGDLLNAGGTAFSRTMQNTSQNLTIGAHGYDATYTGYFNGCVSEVEVYKGVALHTASFTPSSDPFPDTYVRVSGITKDASGNPAARLVRVYRRDTAALVGQVVSDATTGEYVVTAVNSGTTTPLKHVAYMHTAETGVHVPWRVLGLHCDGTNTSTTFTDVHGKTVTANGNAQISTAQYPALTGKTSSAYFDGTGDYLSIAASSDFNFGTGDFTYRMRWRPSTLAAAQSLVYHTDDAGVTGSGEFAIVYNTTLGLRFYLNAGAAGTVSQGATTGWSIDTWYDIEAVRSGTTLTLRRDGTSIASGTCSAQVGTSDKTTYLFGQTFDPLYSTGYFSEVEIYKGVALHTADFTPLTVPFYDEIGTATDNAIIFDDITPY